MMSSGSGELTLAAEFPQPTPEQWRREVEKVLRRSGLLAEGTAAPETVEDLLASESYDGITLRPLYTDSPEDAGFPGLAPFVRGSQAQGCVAEGWDVRQQCVNPDPTAANREMLADVRGGARSVWLRVGDAGVAVGQLAEALDGIRLDGAGVVLDAGLSFAAAAKAFLDLAHDQGVAPSSLLGNLGADPIGLRARTGVAPEPGEMVEIASRCAREYPAVRAIVVDGLPYHEAGGSDAEELGCTLAAATTYLRWLTEAGVDVDTACGLLEFRYAASTDQFATIAKLRAARRLWAQVARTCGASRQGQEQHAVTSPAMLTRRDPWVNILRATVAAFAAGVGGAQAVTVLPFDAALGLPDTTARRLARNTQSMLLAESHLARVIDPMGGSWYGETLTEQVSEAAWEWFRTIEAAGGMPAALDSGLVADQLAATSARRREAIAHRRDPITGVSEYPEVDEPLLERHPAPEQPVGGLPRLRYAEDFEQLRDTADALATSDLGRPTVFLATLGPLTVHNARLLFARNLLAAGGVAAPDAGPTESAQDVVDAFQRAGTTLVCLCSNDQWYTDRGSEVVAELRAAGASFVLLAGKPTTPVTVDGFVHTGCDAVAVLEEVHRRWTQR